MFSAHGLLVIGVVYSGDPRKWVALFVKRFFTFSCYFYYTRDKLYPFPREVKFGAHGLLVIVVVYLGDPRKLVALFIKRL